MKQALFLNHDRSEGVALIFLKLGTLLEHLKLFFFNFEFCCENFLMGLKIDFKFEILGILVQNPHR